MHQRPGPGPWTFLTNHAHVLLCLAAAPGSRVRDIADRVGISERAVLRILHDLVEAGYVTRQRAGRRSHYREASQPVGRLVEALSSAWVPGASMNESISDRSPNPQPEPRE